jgi:hypothetical protein
MGWIVAVIASILTAYPLILAVVVWFRWRQQQRDFYRGKT